MSSASRPDLSENPALAGRAVLRGLRNPSASVDAGKVEKVFWPERRAQAEAYGTWSAPAARST